jgi:DNA-binding MarR family transcriptional regulator
MKREARRREPVSQREYEALAAFRSTLREFLAFSESAAESAGLTPRQHQALLAIKGMAAGHAPSVGELAAHLGVRHHSAVGLLDRLEALGLVERQTKGPDRRRVQLVLSAHGARAIEHLAAAHRDELRQIGPRLEAVLAALDTGPLGNSRGKPARAAAGSRRQ